MNNPLTPNTSLLASLGSIVVHVKEMLSPDGHAFDKPAIEGLLADPAVEEWLEQMDQMVLLPKLRSQEDPPEPKRKK